MANGSENQGQKQKKFKWPEYWIGNKATIFLRKLLPREKIPEKSREGDYEMTSLRNLYKPLIDKNDGMIEVLTTNIEREWTLVEEAIYGEGGQYDYEKDKYGKHIVDLVRQVQYFRDAGLANDEANIFKELGTISIQPTIISQIIDNSDPQHPKVHPTISVPMDKIITTGHHIYMPGLGPEEIVALGNEGSKAVTNVIASLSGDITTLATRPGFDARLRGELPRLTNILTDKLKKFRDFELDHASELGKISNALQTLTDKAKDDIPQHRAPVAQIRFPHTYMIIDSKSVDNLNRTFKQAYPNFKRADELASGLDENGYPLEVFEYPEHSGDYYVLVDKWWEELSKNSWHETTIKLKTCGEQKWRDKVISIRVNPGSYAAGLDISGVSFRYQTVRKIPNPEVFVSDLNPLDKLCFMSNEWDAFRDDRRDGRWHKHSKTIMCYILQRDVTPEKPINFDINIKDMNVMINFKPVYYTKGNFPNWESMTAEQKRVAGIGTINPRGGMGSVTTKNIPEDERKVSRVYDMDMAVRVLDPADRNPDPEQVRRPNTRLHEVRTPSHLNPSFDRAALTHEMIHWGRMFYYEGVEGINRWSENPFPHITTRGMSKYVIDLVLRDTFSFNDAREVLKGAKLGDHKYDYGIRHYGEPFTLDPLGPADAPGGSLWHAKKVAERLRTGGH